MPRIWPEFQVDSSKAAVSQFEIAHALASIMAMSVCLKSKRRSQILRPPQVCPGSKVKASGKSL